MGFDAIREAAEQMLRDFTSFSRELGGLEFYGYSAEFKDLLQSCREFASHREGETRSFRKIYVFVEDHHGKSSLAKATFFEAMANGNNAFRFDGSAGASTKEIKDLQEIPDAVIIVDGVPEIAVKRAKFFDYFNSLSGRALLFASPEYFTDAGVLSDIPWLKINHVDQRPTDKLAWLIGLVREYLRDDAGMAVVSLSEALRNIPINTLLTLSTAPLGSKVSEISDLARRIAQALRLRVNLQPKEPLSEEELAGIFIDFYSRGTSQAVPGFRLWVEGESDCRILKLVSKLVAQAQGIDLEEGLAILPLGEGRAGGTSRAVDVVLEKRTKQNRDVFLLDSDEPGRHAQEKLKDLGQDVVMLDPSIACSRVEKDVEIEDFISLSCLDRFYTTHPDLRPEKEIIKYRAPASRRLMIEGTHKETLINWLEASASLADLEHLAFVLCDVRSRFSLRNLPLMNDKPSWKKRLQEESSPIKHFGNRPGHWS